MLTLEIVNWQKFNPRSDIKKPSWYRLENSWTSDPDFYDWPCDARIAWLHLLSIASQRNDHIIKVIPAQVAGTINVDEAAVLLCIEKACAIGCLQIVNGELGQIPSYIKKNPDPVQNPDACGRKSPATGRDGTGRDSCAPNGALVDGSTPSLDPPGLAAIWNEAATPAGLPVADVARLKAGSGRWRHCLARIKEDSTPEYWREVAKRIAESDFCLGKNDRGWRADFGFFVSATGHTRTMEGRYDNRKPVGQGAESRGVTLGSAMDNSWLEGGGGG